MPIECKVIQCNITRTNQKEEVIWEGHITTIRYFWDSHGRMVPFTCNNLYEYKCPPTKVKLIKKTWTDHFEHSEPSDWEMWKLQCADIPEEFLSGDVSGIKNGIVTMVVGWG